MKIINTIGNIRQITIGILKELMLRREIKMSLLEVDGYFYIDRKSTRLNSSHSGESRMPSSA